MRWARRSSWRIFSRPSRQKVQKLKETRRDEEWWREHLIVLANLLQLDSQAEEANIRDALASVNGEASKTLTKQCAWCIWMCDVESGTESTFDKQPPLTPFASSWLVSSVLLIFHSSCLFMLFCSTSGKHIAHCSVSSRFTSSWMGFFWGCKSWRRKGCRYRWTALECPLHPFGGLPWHLAHRKHLTCIQMSPGGAPNVSTKCASPGQLHAASTCASSLWCVVDLERKLEQDWSACNALLLYFCSFEVHCEEGFASHSLSQDPKIERLSVATLMLLLFQSRDISSPTVYFSTLRQQYRSILKAGSAVRPSGTFYVHSVRLLSNLAKGT